MAERVAGLARSGEVFASPSLLRGLFVPIEQLLVGGGDQRLELARPTRQNKYGCTPFPNPDLIDFASSTASCISQEAYARVLAARDEMLAAAMLDGAGPALDKSVAAARGRLLALLQLDDCGAEAVFAASGTDAQVQTLYLARALFGPRLTSIIVGADQTGSGTHYTARGRHFSHVTAGGDEVEIGAPIAGLDGVRAIGVDFAKAGGFRSPAEMDRAVLEAVEAAAADDAKILLQTMDASKFGWRAPSDACIERIMQRWPHKVQVIVDACQLRCPRERLRAWLDKGYLVQVTGSKFFTGPAFSGALMVPPALAARARALADLPFAMPAYSSAQDWPEGWSAFRRIFSGAPNIGQWLRWEAALEEMTLYYAVPLEFREQVLAVLGAHIKSRIGARLRLLETAPGGGLFAVVPLRGGVPLSLAQCNAAYHALRRDLSGLGDMRDGNVAQAACQLGQPVALADGAALRIALSARSIRQCWSPGGPNIARMKAGIDTLFNKLDFVLRHIDRIAP